MDVNRRVWMSWLVSNRSSWYLGWLCCSCSSCSTFLSTRVSCSGPFSRCAYITQTKYNTRLKFPSQESHHHFGWYPWANGHGVMHACSVAPAQRHRHASRSIHFHAVAPALPEGLIECCCCCTLVDCGDNAGKNNIQIHNKLSEMVGYWNQISWTCKLCQSV